MKVHSDKFPAYVLEEEAEMWTGDLDTEWDRSTAQTKHTELGIGIAANPVWGGQGRISRGGTFKLKPKHLVVKESRDGIPYR